MFFLREFCQTSAVLRVILFIKELMRYVFILVPIGLILMTSVDFAKNVIASREDEMKKNLNVAIKRVIMTVFLFFVPTIVSVVKGLLDESGLLRDMKLDTYYVCIENANKEVIDEIVLEEEYEKSFEEANRVNNRVSDISTSSPGYIIGSGSNGVSLDSLLDAGKRVWDTVVNGDKHFAYNANTNHQIPITGNQCDCSSLVSWILYEAGYEDFKGKQKKSWDFYNTNWNELYGWQEISVNKGEDVTDKVKAGDILVRVPVINGKGGSGHINFIAKVESGTIYVYDCGSNDLIRNGQYPTGVRSTWFLKGNSGNAQNPGKIIRVAR